MVLKRSLPFPAIACALSTFSGAADARLEEVVVTAQRKAESLQETPLSLVAFDESAIERDGINTLMDLKANVPGMTIEPFPLDNSNLRIYIRGVGLIDSQVTQDTPIGVYMDGVYIARSAGLSLDLAELQRIEVLRGPQGTLYGRNSTGGTVNLVTRSADPAEFTFEQKATVGTYGLRTSRTSVNVPFADRYAVKLAYLTTRHDGYIENTGLGEDFGSRDAYGYRIDLRGEFTENLTADYSYEKADSGFTSLSYQPFRPQPQSTEVNETSLINNQLRREAQRYMVYSEDRREKMFAAVPILESTNIVSGHKLDVRYQFENAELQYLLGLRDLDNNAYADVSTGSLSTDFRVDLNAYTSKDGTLSTPVVIPSLVQDQVSHELKLTGAAWDGRVEYIAGLYAFEEDAIQDQPYHHEFSGLISNQLVPVTGIRAKSNLVQLGEQRFTIANTAKAAYARLSYIANLFNRELTYTVGARHSEDSRYAHKYTSTELYTETWTEDANGNVIAATVVPIETTGYVSAGDRDFRDDSFDFIVEYQLEDAINIYAKVAEAYKSGGYNTRDTDPDFFARGFDEEKALSYEIGMKGEFLDNSLRVNADIFQTRYDDLQVNFQIDGAIDNTRVLNVGKAKVNGFEMDVTYAATTALRFTFNYAYLDAKITSVKDRETGAEVADQFVFSSAPEHSYSASVDWVVRQADWGLVEASVSYNYMDERNGGPLTEKVPNVELEAFSLLNARIGVSDIALFGGNASVALWAKNLLDEEYTINAFDHLPQASKAAVWGDPRTAGVDLIWRY